MSSSNSKNVNVSNRKTKVPINSAKYEKNRRRMYKSISRGKLEPPVAPASCSPPSPLAGLAAVARTRACALRRRRSRIRLLKNPIARSQWLSRRNGSLPRKSGAHHEQQVVQRNQNDGDQRSRRAPAASWLRSNRYRNQSKDETSGGKRKPPVKFHARLAPPGTLVLQQRSNGSLGIAELPRLCGHQAVDFDGPVALSERRHGIVIRIVSGKLVGRAALKVQLQLALLRFGNDNRVLRQGEA